jgi:hypothetical protein
MNAVRLNRMSVFELEDRVGIQHFQTLEQNMADDRKEKRIKNRSHDE